jgi:hypothetical protein
VAVYVTNTLRQLERDLRRDLRQREARVMAAALNATIFDVRERLIDELPQHFTIRNTWTERGTRVTKATTTEPTAIVGSVRDYMEIQTVGGQRRSASGERVGVPFRARPRPKSRITPAKFPGALLRKRAFQIGELVLERRGRGRKRANVVMYYLARSVRVRPAWPLEETLRRVVATEWQDNIRTAMQRLWRR